MGAEGSPGWGCKRGSCHSTFKPRRPLCAAGLWPERAKLGGLEEPPPVSVLFPGGQGLCSEAQERVGTAVCLSLWRALSWPEKPRAAIDSAPTLGASESLHQGMGIPWGNSVLSSFCLVCFLSPLREMLQQSDFLAFITCSQAHGSACASLHSMT